MLLLKRVLANLVDIAFFFAVLVGGMIFVTPFIYPVVGNNTAAAAVVLVLTIISIFGAQYVFMRDNQTIGKAFFGLHIVSTNKIRNLTPSIIFQREIFAKVMSVYLMCLPVLIGQEGWHEKATETKVVSNVDRG